MTLSGNGFKQWADMSAEEREAEAQAVSALFVGLPHVVGAPLIMGPDYWVEVARHCVECGVRLVADPIKHYEPGDSIAKSRAAGKWVYDHDEPAESDEQRIQRMAREQRAEFRAELKRRREAGLLPPEGSSPSQVAAWRRNRAAAAEAAAFDAEVTQRRADNTLTGSPLEDIAEDTAPVKAPKKRAPSKRKKSEGN